MADEPVVADAPVEGQDTPPAAPEEGTPAPDQTAPEATDWKQRYEDLRPEFDRRNELLSAAQGLHGPEAQAEALRRLGVELQIEEAENESSDDFADPMEEIQKIRQEIAQRDEAAKAAEFDRLETEYIDKTVGELEAKEGIELTEKEYQVVVNNALANRLQDDRPDLEGAFADLKEIQGAARDRYAASKTAAAKAPIGTPGEDKIDLSDKEARRKFAAEVYDAEEGAENT